MPTGADQDRSAGTKADAVCTANPMIKSGQSRSSISPRFASRPPLIMATAMATTTTIKSHNPPSAISSNGTTVSA